MARWECIVCGLIYDEKDGWPDDGIAPGTKWEDVPEDWLCPDCGVGKDDFELIDDGEAPVAETQPVAAAPVERPVVIIGTGLAGYNLVREFRRLDADKPVLMITSDDGAFYSKPMLSTGYTKDTDAQKLATADATKMAEDNRIEILTFTKVTAIDAANHTITLDSGETRAYAKLVIAWGADTITPPLTGNGMERVYAINDLMDYDVFRKSVASQQVKKVLIIGAGLIGSEFANDLSNGGFDLDVVDPLHWSLPTLLPETAGRAVQSALEERGVRFHFGRLVKDVSLNAAGNGIVGTLDDGSTLEADIAVSAIGVRPRLELAKQAGIQTGRGVITNRLLETSEPDIYALGDCAEVCGHVLYYIAPLMACARALARTLSGTPTEVSYPAMPVLIKTPACPVIVSPPPHGAVGEWQIDGDGRDLIAQFRDATGALLGFALTGEGTKQKMRLQRELPAVMP